MRRKNICSSVPIGHGRRGSKKGRNPVPLFLRSRNEITSPFSLDLKSAFFVACLGHSPCYAPAQAPRKPPRYLRDFRRLHSVTTPQDQDNPVTRDTCMLNPCMRPLRIRHLQAVPGNQESPLHGICRIRRGRRSHQCPCECGNSHESGCRDIIDTLMSVSDPW